jgi:hypothetical protein
MILCYLHTNRILLTGGCSSCSFVMSFWLFCEYTQTLLVRKNATREESSGEKSQSKSKV